MKVSLLHPSQFKLDGGAMFGIIPKPLWEKKIKSDEFNRIEMSLRVVFIETQNRKILIDTGLGNYHPEKFNSQFSVTNHTTSLGEFIDTNLKVSPNEITDIIITHLHFDHVGGLGDKDGKGIIFPNATIHLHEKHFEYSKKPTMRDSGSFHSHLFLELLNYYKDNNKLNLVNEDQGILIKDGNDKISYKISFGHTPYMLHPIFSDYIYMADLVPMSHHVKLPWVMGYDIEPGVTTIYKEKFYNDIMDRKLKMIFEHDVDFWGGTLFVNEKNQFDLKEKFLSHQSEVQELE